MKAYNLQADQAPSFPTNYRVLQSIVLNRTSLEANNNKFYVMELHEADGKYRLFTHYGRVGTEGIREGRYADAKETMMEQYERILKEKTNPKKGYVPVEVEKSTVGSNILQVESERNFQAKRGMNECKLHPDVINFVEHIYEESKAELVRRIETPLGSLSLSQIEKGADKLKEIRFAIARGHSQQTIGLTGSYFSLIPHRLGRITNADDVAINTIEKADSEEELLQLMRDIYHIQDNLNSEVDMKYQALGAHLQPIERDNPNYRRIEKKVYDSQSDRHYFKVRVNRIFDVKLPGERKQFKQIGQNFGNVQELFHGTRNCNMVGILSRGLLIAPKNVQVTGYMFGKGVYFADQSTKSAQYSLINPNNRRKYAYLFLADVALGKIKPETAPIYREDAPDGFDSVQGCKGSYLVHNEFIVYRTAQCTLRHIAEIELA